MAFKALKEVLEELSINREKKSKIHRLSAPLPRPPHLRNQERGKILRDVNGDREKLGEKKCPIGSQVFNTTD